MKIAMIGQKGIPATYGGVERHVEELAARLVARGHAVTAYCRGHYTPAGLREHRGVRLRTLPTVPTKHLDAITGCALAACSATFGRYDVVHFHALGPSLLSWLPRLRLRGRPSIIATVHGLDYRRRKWGPLARWCLKRGEGATRRFPDRTIVVSRALEAHYRELGRSVAHIPNGVAEPVFAPLDAAGDLGLTSRRFVLWLGRFVPEKRVEDIIDAAAALPADWRMVLAGELAEGDRYVRGLQARAEANERVLFPGGLYGAAKHAMLSHAGVLVSASELEGFPIALLEGMRYGLPVVASDIPEHGEAITPAEDGLLFPLGDASVLADAIRHVIADPTHAAALGRRAAETSQRFDWDRIAEETEGVYRRALAGTTSQRHRSAS